MSYIFIISISISIMGVIFYLLQEEKEKVKRLTSISNTRLKDAVIFPLEDKVSSINMLLEPYRQVLRENRLHSNNQLFIEKTILGLGELVFEYDVFNTIEYDISKQLGLLDFKYLTAKRLIPIMDDIVKSNPDTLEEMRKLFSIDYFKNPNYRKDVFKKTRDFIVLHKSIEPGVKLLILYTEPELVEEAKVVFEDSITTIQHANDDIVDSNDHTLCYYI